MNNALRPLSLGEILDQTAQLYRRNFLLFAGTALIPSAVLFGIYIVIGVAVGVPMIRSAAAGQPNPAIGGLFVVVMFIAMPFLLVPMVFSQAGITRATVSAFRGTKLTVREALTGVRPRFWRYLGLMILQGLIIVGIPGVCAGVVVLAMVIGTRLWGGGGLAVLMGVVAFCVIIAAVVFAIVLATEYGMGIAACIVEDKPAWDALQRARTLSKGSRGRIFVMFLVVWCMMIVLSMIGYIPTLIAAGLVGAIGHGSQYAVAALVIVQVLNLLVNLLLQTLVSPAYLVALVMFYFDQRVRLEGYDIEWMMQQAGLSAPAAVTAPGAVTEFSQADSSPAPAQEQ